MNDDEKEFEALARELWQRSKDGIIKTTTKEEWDRWYEMKANISKEGRFPVIITEDIDNSILLRELPICLSEDEINEYTRLPRALRNGRK